MNYAIMIKRYILDISELPQQTNAVGKKVFYLSRSCD